MSRFNKILFLFAVIPPGGTTPGATTDFLGYARFLFPFALSAAAVLAVIMLIIAGLEMMTASEGLREDAKRRIWGAVLGLLLAVGTFLILNTINPQLINLKLTLPTVPGGGGQPPGPGPGPGPGDTCTNPSKCTESQCAPAGSCPSGTKWSASNCGCAPISGKPVCGNTILEIPEQCDDGNIKNGDGCSSDCKLESSGGINPGPGGPIGCIRPGVGVTKEYCYPTKPACESAGCKPPAGACTNSPAATCTGP